MSSEPESRDLSKRTDDAPRGLRGTPEGSSASSPHLADEEITGPGLSNHVAVYETFRSHSGPLPSPQTLSEYAAVDPALPERIVAMAEREQTHRQAMERQALEADIEDGRAARREQRRGQICGLVVALAAFAVAGLLTWLGHPVTGGIFAGTTVVALVTVFVTGRIVQRQEPREPVEG